MPDPDRPPVLRGLFLVWGPRHKGPRSARLAAALGIPAFFVAERWERGLGNPMKYPRMLWRTMAILVQHRPRAVLVQSPPTIAAWIVAAYAWMAGATLVVDAHSDAFQRARWTRPAFLNRLVTRRASATLVTDEHWARGVRAAGGRAMVLPDIPVAEAVGASPGDGPSRGEAEGFRVMVVNTWAGDEPLREVLDAAAELPGATFHVTGAADDRVGALGAIPGNVRFTGFLPTDDYLALMAGSDAVVCLTTRDHTMQRGACEALALGRPIVTSDWPLLRDYFAGGTVHVDNSANGIRDGVGRLMADHARFVAEVRDLRSRRIADWQSRREELMSLLAPATRTDRREGAL